MDSCKDLGYNEFMVNVVAIALIIFSILQIITGAFTLAGKFDPLLPKERKKLPTKIRKKARLLNAISMIVTSVIFCILSVGLLLNLEIRVTISAILMATFIIVMLIVSLKVEARHLR